MSSFGEIVEPGTRTAWEDWDENIQEDSRPKLMWQSDVQVPDEIHSLFILEGRHISNSIKSLTKFKLQLQNAIQEANLKLYRTEATQVYICVLSDYNLLLASEIVELLKPYITVSKNIMGIITKPFVEYQATEYTGQQYVMRSLSTTKPLAKPLAMNVPKLEQPNIVSGVTAGVINLREIMNESGAAIICYMEHNEEYQINELQELLNQLNFGMVQSQPGSISNSNLYI